MFSPQEIEKDKVHFKIIIASAAHFKDMENTLKSCGILEEQIIVPYRVFDYFKTLYRKGKERDDIRRVCFWPPINDNNQDLLRKISWFIPDRMEVSVWCDNDKLENQFNQNVHLERSVDDKDRVFQEAEIIFLWRTNVDENEYIKYIDKIYVVDPYFYSYIETLNYHKIYYSSFSVSEKAAYREKSKKIFSELKRNAKKGVKARVFCSGPSIDEIHDNVYDDSINIICNSMVKDKEWLERVKPYILTFMDLNYFLSPTKYCEQFLQDVLEGQRLYDYYIVVCEHEVPLLLSHCPELSGKVIGIAPDSDEYMWPDEQKLKVRGSENIFTGMMIPLASALCDEIEIAGCTGRNPDENFYWKHSGRTQYLDLMQTIFDMYPSVFRDQNYANYYEGHCQRVEDLLEFGEKKGKKYKNITTSYIPALAKRN